MPFTADFLTPDEADLIRAALAKHKDADAIIAKLPSLTEQPRICANCGITFTSKNLRRTTCSDACRQALSRKIRREAYQRELEAKLVALDS